MGDGARVRWISRWARGGAPPPLPPGVATPSGSPFEQRSSSWTSKVARVEPRPPVGRALTWWVRALASAWAVACVTASALALRAYVEFEDWLDGDTALPVWRDAHDAMRVAELAALAGAAIVIVPLVVWTYRATCATSRHGVGDRRWGPVSAVVGWFVPVANLLVPWLVLREDERIARAAVRERVTTWTHVRLPTSSNLWWLLLVVGAATVAFGKSMDGAPGDAQLDVTDTRRAQMLAAMGWFLVGAAAALLALVVGRIARFDRAHVDRR